MRLEVVRAMAKLAEQDLTPGIPLRGSISASGDLSFLAYIASVLRGSWVSFSTEVILENTVSCLLMKFLYSLVSYQTINLLTIIDSSYAGDVVEMLSMMLAIDLYLLCCS